MKPRTHRVNYLGICLLTMAPSVQAQEEAADVFAKVQPAVVSLSNIEGSGTGMLLTSDGLILTNAHVVSSPLPFTCEANIFVKGQEKSVKFEKVRILGVHPQKDMALVKIDPSEHRGALKTVSLSKKKAVPGQRVYAIGNPGGGGIILNKTITSGIISGVDRMVEGVAYYQVDAGINPGNSGGPLVDRDGEVLGMVTLKFTDVENVGFAIPLLDLETKSFVAQSDRKGDKRLALQLAKIAQQYSDRANQLVDRGADRDDPQVTLYGIMAAHYYHMALSEDPSSTVLLTNLGIMLRVTDQNEASAAYLLYAIELDPWNQSSVNTYQNLGLTLLKLDLLDEAKGAWTDAASKFPHQAGKIWENLAVFYMKSRQDPYEAALAAEIAKEVGHQDLRRDYLDKIIRDAREKLSSKERDKLDDDVSDIPKRLKSLEGEARLKQKRKQDYVDPEFNSYVAENGVLYSRKKNAGSIPDVATNDRSKPMDRPRTSSTAEETPEEKPELDLSIPKGSINLIETIRPSSDIVSGKWTLRRSTIVSPFTRGAALAFDHDAPAEYDLTIIVERTSNSKEFALGLPADSKRFVLNVDAEGGQITSLNYDKSASHSGRVLPSRKPVTLVVKVRESGVTVTAGGKSLLEGDSPGQSTWPSLWTIPSGKNFFLGTGLARFTIHKLMLTPVKSP
jgi:S1-C subfamily serine protease